MATKSVIEIDVLDEKFQTFAKEFEKIKKSLANLRRISTRLPPIVIFRNDSN